jgi:hypothetical protein
MATDGNYAYGSTDGGSTWSTLGTPGAVGDAYALDLQSCGAGACWGIETISTTGAPYVIPIESPDGGSTWVLDNQVPDVLPIAMTIAPDGTMIALGVEPSNGPVILTSP